VIVALAAGFLPIDLLVSVSLGLLAFLLGLLPTLPLARITLEGRDTAMGENIQKVLDSRNDVQRGCLVVGRGHLPGAEEALKSSEIELGRIHKSAFLRESLEDGVTREKQN
jgi:pheromone shutdown protein TraB